MSREPSLSPDSKSPTYLTVNEEIRPRANSDPTNGAALSIQLPEIMVEDYSVPSNSASVELCEGGLVIPQQRQRANTCPEELFRKRRNRPATPPPTRKAGGPNRFMFKSSPKRETVSFVVHKLGKLAEDGESATVSCRSLSKAEMNRRRSMPEPRLTKSCSNFRARLPLADSVPFEAEETTTPSNVCVGKPSVLTDAAALCDAASLSTQGLEERSLCGNAKDCRYSGSLSRPIDAAQLQAY